MRLFEFGDLQWVPKWYHFYMRRYLVFFYKLFGYYKLWIPAVSAFIEKTGSRSYLECCSGSGEVLGLVISNLPENLVKGKNFVLSDISPLPEFIEQVNRKSHSNIRYCEIPIDATQIPEEMNNPRIFINSFHHFPSETAKQIIESSIISKQGIIILEYVRHSPLGYISMLTGSLMIFLTLPFIAKPRDLPLLALLTYIVPIFPLMFFWDGIISCLRVYTPDKLASIVSEANVQAEITSLIKRSILYPAGVSAINIIPK